MKATTGRIAPLHIRSTAIKGAGSSLRIVAGAGMAAFPLNIAEQAPAPVKRGAWRERDLRRALAVARRARLRDYRVEIAPDGTISIVVGNP